MVCFLGNGMLNSMLSPYLESIGATVSQIGLMFFIYGLVYMIGTSSSGMVSNIAMIRQAFYSVQNIRVIFHTLSCQGC